MIERSRPSRRSVSATRSPRESPDGGLVEHHQLRLPGLRHPHLELALLAVGERADERRQLRRQAHGLGELACLSADRAVAVRAARPAARARSGCRARRDTGCPRPTARGRGVTSGTCRDIPSLALVRAGANVVSLPEELDRPRGRLDVTRDHVEQRRLARAVRPEDGAALAVRDVEIDVAHGVEAAEPPADPPQAEDRLGRLGWCCRGHPCYGMTFGCCVLPTHGSERFTQGGKVRPGGGVLLENVPPNVWSTFGM